jgi:pyrroline-5-carboxylate reductase
MGDWPERIVLVGAGRMGAALAAGWLRRGLNPHSMTILEPNPSTELKELAASRGIALNAPAAPPDVLVLAVKPQALDAAAPEVAPLISAHTLVISIIAGKRIADIRSRAPAARAIVRAMPNTPAAVGYGVTAAFASEEATADQKQWSETLLSAVGAFHWLSGEGDIDSVTAISGSGPAYVFALTEALAAAAERLGLPAELAMSLARGTVEGAAELMRCEPTTPPSLLRQNVPSPGGTTAAALAVLQAEDGIDDLMARATAAARRRAEELAR